MLKRNGRYSGVVHKVTQSVPRETDDLWVEEFVKLQRLGLKPGVEEWESYGS